MTLLYNEKIARAILDASTDSAFLIDIGGKILDLNPIWAKNFGYPVKNLIGRCAFDFFSSDLATSRKKKVQEAINSKKPVRFIDKRAGAILVNNLYPICNEIGIVDKVAVFSRDITNEVMVKDELERRKQKYKQLVDDIAPLSMLYSHDSDGVMTYVSSSSKKIIGLSPDEIVGKKYADVLSWEQESLEIADLSFRKLLNGFEHSDIDMSFYDTAGNLRTLHVVAHAVIDKFDGTKFIDGVATDITQRKNIESREKEIKQKLEYMVRERTEELENVNTTIKVLLEKTKTDRLEVEDRVIKNVEMVCLPILNRLAVQLPDKKLTHLVKAMELNLIELTSSFTSKLTDRKTTLSSSEIQVANLIKQGLSSKEMSDILNISVNTVNNHRANIRKKLHISGKKKNLRSYLSSL